MVQLVLFGTGIESARFWGNQQTTLGSANKNKGYCARARIRASIRRYRLCIH